MLKLGPELADISAGQRSNILWICLDIFQEFDKLNVFTLCEPLKADPCQIINAGLRKIERTFQILWKLPLDKTEIRENALTVSLSKGVHRLNSLKFDVCT